MSLPTFSADAALANGRISYSTTYTPADPANLVIPQDCGFFKGLGCGLGPISWCALASLGGTDSFCRCVATFSGGDCIECTNCASSAQGLDPRDRSNDPSTPTVASGRFGLTDGTGSGGVTVGPPPGRRDSDLSGLRDQLNRIEKCACGIDSQLLETLVPPLSAPMRELYRESPGRVDPSSPVLALERR
jgi:hypothetical protein